MYAIAWTPQAKRSLTRLPEKVATAAVEFIYGPLAVNPQRVGRSLRLDLEGLHSARRGDHRVLFQIDKDGKTVTIVTIDHRADVYRRRSDRR